MKHTADELQHVLFGLLECLKLHQDGIEKPRFTGGAQDYEMDYLRGRILGCLAILQEAVVNNDSLPSVEFMQDEADPEYFAVYRLKETRV